MRSMLCILYLYMPKHLQVKYLTRLSAYNGSRRRHVGNLNTKAFHATCTDIPAADAAGLVYQQNADFLLPTFKKLMPYNHVSACAVCDMPSI
jgi:hypothetical protein